MERSIKRIACLSFFFFFFSELFRKTSVKKLDKALIKGGFSLSSPLSPPSFSTFQLCLVFRWFFFFSFPPPPKIERNQGEETEVGGIGGGGWFGGV